jgi:hypothetical protein
MSFGTLSAVDEAGTDNRLFNVGRAQFSLGPSNYIGALYTDVSSTGTHNRVAGTDLRWRISESQQLNAFVLASNSRRAPGADRSCRTTTPLASGARPAASSITTKAFRWTPRS